MYDYKHYIIIVNEKRYLTDRNKTFTIGLDDISHSKSFNDTWYDSVEINEGKLKGYFNLYIFQATKDLDSEYSSTILLLKQKGHNSDTNFTKDITLFKKNYLHRKDDKYDLYATLLKFMNDVKNDSFINI